MAFEYLSLLSIGDSARHYHHLTIATELQKIVPHTMAETVSEVAVYYAWARYTPPGQELAPEQLVVARAALCRLAGVSP